jgi:hypothetical protein
LREGVPKSPRLGLILDAHASIALLVGAVLDLKSGVGIELVQKGRAGLQIGGPTMAPTPPGQPSTWRRKPSVWDAT